MNKTVYQVAIVGTFDVQNYGDLLFPIIAEAELSKRLGKIQLHRLSYFTKSTPIWPYEVTAINKLPTLMATLDCMLIGGGFIIRFDKFIANNYFSPDDHIHHPTAYWLTPALSAIQAGVPVVWNSPGMHCNPIPKWAESLVKLALEQSTYVRVRDDLTRDSLRAIANTVEIETQPDTAFSLPDMIDINAPSEAFQAIKNNVNLGEKYIIVQSLIHAEPYISLLESNPECLSDFKILLVPIGPVLDDDTAALKKRLPRALSLSEWPAPLVLAEIISHSQGVIGFSYHLAITALSFGVPVFGLAGMDVGKFTSLLPFAAMHLPPREHDMTAPWLAERLGRKVPCEHAERARSQLNAYWDTVASIVTYSKKPTADKLVAFWQNLPNLLEASAQKEEALLLLKHAVEFENQQLTWQLDQAVQAAQQIETLAEAMRDSLGKPNSKQP